LEKYLIFVLFTSLIGGERRLVVVVLEQSLEEQRPTVVAAIRW
jgi:hypothetical protein